MRAVAGWPIPLSVEVRTLAGDGPLTNVDTGTLAFTCTKADGTAHTPGTLANAGTGLYSGNVAALSTPDLLTVTLAGMISGTAFTRQITVDVVAARYFTLPQLRAEDTTVLGDAAKFSDTVLERARCDAEDEVERIMARAWTVRVDDETVAVDKGEVQLSRSPVRAVRYATNLTTGATISPATLTVRGHWSDRLCSSAWSDGHRIRVVYEHGTPGLRHDVYSRVMRRARHYAAQARLAAPEASERVVFRNDGQTIVRTLPGPGRTGDAWVDAVYLGAECRAESFG